MKKFLSILLKILLILICCFLLFLIYSSIREYKPPVYSVVAESTEIDELKDSVFTALIWNIGYAGLGANMDFFYDGGENVRDSYGRVSRNFGVIKDFLLSNAAIDFILLQEVDINSKRSYGMNQLKSVDSLLVDHTAYLGTNYKVDFVPIPPNSPLGRVNSGILTLSKLPARHVSRQGFIDTYAWPMKTFMLKRCFLLARYPVKGGRELVIINIHNSAYDDGSLRAAQLNVLQEIAMHEYDEGNFVLFGGDWNQSPARFEPSFEEPFDTDNLSFLPEDFLPNWQFVYSNTVPSNRRIISPYRKGVTPVTLIDFYVASPNVRVLDMHAFDLRFQNSDHNPVAITFMID